MFTFELTNGLVATWLRKHHHHAALAEQSMKLLVVTLFLSGTCWGLSAWLPGLKHNELKYCINFCVLVVVGSFSIQNLHLDWRAQAAFSTGLFWPMLTQNTGLEDLEVVLFCVAVVASFVMTQIYSASSRIIELRQIEQKFEVIRLAEALRTRNGELSDALEIISSLASKDPLIGCLNRRALLEKVESHGRRRADSSSAHGVLMIDADHFKQINDRYGHDAGDRVLVALAECALTVLRNTDLLGRWGGEEFVCFVSDVDESTLIETAERLRVEISRLKITTKAGPIEVTVSVGVALIDSEESFTAAVDRADHALYRAKAGGRNCVCI